MQFKQGGDTKVVKQVKQPIEVTQEGKTGSNFLFSAVVGDFHKQDSVANAVDFEHFAIVKIKLGATKDSVNKEYKEALNKAESKKAPFYLAMVSHSLSHMLMKDEVKNELKNNFGSRRVKQ